MISRSTKELPVMTLNMWTKVYQRMILNKDEMDARSIAWAVVLLFYKKSPSTGKWFKTKD